MNNRLKNSRLKKPQKYQKCLKNAPKKHLEKPQNASKMPQKTSKFLQSNLKPQKISIHGPGFPPIQRIFRQFTPRRNIGEVRRIARLLGGTRQFAACEIAQNTAFSRHLGILSMFLTIFGDFGGEKWKKSKVLTSKMKGK
jgi:hypothetical protein